MSSESKNWYALYTKPRHEFKAEEQLTILGIENYLPKITLLKRWSDRKKKVTEPLFRGYIFIKADEKERLTAVQQNMIVKTVFFNGKPSVVPDFEIENLRNMLKIAKDVKVFDGLVKGTRVKVSEGPFQNVEGIVYGVSKNESMLAINIELLNRTVVVKLPPKSVTKITAS